MKNILNLRVLCGLSFLLLMAPFYDQCNGKFMKDTAKEEVPVEQLVSEIDSVKSLNNYLVENDTIDTHKINNIVEEESLFLKTYKFVDVAENENAFEMAFLTKFLFEGDSWDEFILDVKKDYSKNKFDNLSFMIRSISFVFIVTITIVVLILSFFRKNKMIYRLTRFNFIFVVLSLICIVFFDSNFETFKQIKWGFYLYMISQFLIIVSSKKIVNTV